MDGVSAAVNIIALVSALKDLYDLCKQIRQSFLKVKENRQAIENLRCQLTTAINEVKNIIGKYRADYCNSEYLGALDSLRCDLLDVLQQCTRLWNENQKKINISPFRAWRDADKVEKKMRLLETAAKDCHDRMSKRLLMQTALNTEIIRHHLGCSSNPDQVALDQISPAFREATTSSLKRDGSTSELEIVSESLENNTSTFDVTSRSLRRASSNLEVSSYTQSTQSTARRASFTGYANNNLAHSDPNSHSFSSPTNMQTQYLAPPPIQYGVYKSTSQSATSSSTSLQTDFLPSYEYDISFTPPLVGLVPSYDEDRSNILYESYINLAKKGQLQEALDVLDEAIKIHKRLAKSSSKPYLLELSGYLQMSARLLHSLGRDNDAAERFQNAIEILRRLKRDGENLDREIAVGLIDLSSLMHSMKRIDVALKYAREALVVLQNLNDEAEQASDTDIPRTHFGLALIYIDKNDDKEAYGHLLQAIEEMRRMRTLAESNMEHAERLVSYLRPFVQCCSRLGQHEESFNAAKELIDIYLLLINSSTSSKNRDNSSRELDDDCCTLLGSKSYRAALVICKAAVDLRRCADTIEISSTNHRRGDLGLSLRHLSHCLLNVGENDKALTAIKEATGIHKALTYEDSGDNSYSMQLAKDVSCEASILCDMRQFQSALPSANLAVDLYRQLAGQSPNGHKRFHNELQRLAQCLHALGMETELSDVDCEIAAIISSEMSSTSEFSHSL